MIMNEKDQKKSKARLGLGIKANSLGRKKRKLR
jgi:hypothetical protein